MAPIKQINSLIRNIYLFFPAKRQLKSSRFSDSFTKLASLPKVLLFKPVCDPVFFFVYSTTFSQHLVIHI